LSNKAAFVDTPRRGMPTAILLSTRTVCTRYHRGASNGASRYMWCQRIVDFPEIVRERIKILIRLVIRPRSVLGPFAFLTTYPQNVKFVAVNGGKPRKMVDARWAAFHQDRVSSGRVFEPMTSDDHSRSRLPLLAGMD
jgi:hypothetical protein